jgi:HEPN domain-containing protein
MKPPRPWETLLRKAEQDEYVVDTLMTLSDSPDEVIGFHLQQAAEKLLKAALGVRGIPYRRTHNLGELIHLLDVRESPIPISLDSLHDLTPYATEWRYDFLPDEDGGETFDRTSAREAVRQLRNWVEELVRIGPPLPPQPGT